MLRHELELSFGSHLQPRGANRGLALPRLALRELHDFQRSSHGIGLALFADVASTNTHSPSRYLDRLARLGRDVGGAVFVEYSIVFGLVGIVVTLMLVKLGPAVVEAYSARRGTLYSHSP
jgi:hypothetical protein